MILIVKNYSIHPISIQMYTSQTIWIYFTMAEVDNILLRPRP